MNYNLLYTITPKLDQIYEKLLKLDKYDFDYSKLKKEINIFDQKLNSIKEESNNLMGAETLAKPDERLLDDLNEAITNFEKYIDSILSSFGLLDNLDLYNKILNKNELNENELNKLVEKVLNDLLGYKKLLDNGYKNKKEDISKLLYSIIKKEYQLKGDSTLFNALYSMHMDYLISNLVEEESQKHLDDEKISSRYLNYRHKDIDEKETKELLLLLSFEDNKELKQDVIERGNTIKSEANKIQNDIKRKEKKIEETKDNISDEKIEARRKRNYIFKEYLSFLLSISLLAGGGIAIHNWAKPITKTYYKLDKECYDTVDGDYYTSSYSETYDKGVLLKVYSDADEKGNRQVSTYLISDRFDDISDYLNVELNEGNLINETTINDPIINNKSKGAFTSVEVIKNVDEENVLERKGSAFKVIAFEVLLSIAWIILNIILYHHDTGAFYPFEDDFATTEIHELSTINKRLKNYAERNKELLKESKELQEKYNEFLKASEEFEKRFAVLFKDDELTKKLS